MKERKKPSLKELDSLSITAMNQIRGGQFVKPTQNQNQNQQFEFHGTQDGYKIGPAYWTGPK